MVSSSASTSSFGAVDETAVWLVPEWRSFSVFTSSTWSLSARFSSSERFVLVALEEGETSLWAAPLACAIIRVYRRNPRVARFGGCAFVRVRHGSLRLQK